MTLTQVFFFLISSEILHRPQQLWKYWIMIYILNSKKYFWKTIYKIKENQNQRFVGGNMCFFSITYTRVQHSRQKKFTLS